MSRLLWGEWLPDQPAHLTKGLITAQNVYPGPNGYRPVGGFEAITSAMSGLPQGSDFRGGAAFVASNGTSTTLAANEAALYSYTGSWTLLYGSFSLGTNERWRFAQFGDLAVCVQGSTPLKVNLTTGVTALLGGSPPTADLVTVVRDFVVLGRTGGNDQRVTWSAFNNAEGWTAGTNQSGFQPMLTGGSVMGLVGGEYGIILQRNRIVRMTYTGDSTVFQFDEISSNIGCVAEGSVVQAGRRFFFYSDRGFMMCDGASEPVPIGKERVDRTFAAAYSRSDLSLMSAAVDPINTVVMWAMPNRLWCYDWVQDRWSFIDTNAKAVFSGFTFDTYIDALAISNIDASSIYVDDPSYQGGNPLLIVVNLSQVFGTLTGDTLPARIETVATELVAGRNARLRRAWPLTDATDGITLTIDSRARLGDSPNEEAFTTLNASGDMPVRTSGRYHKFRLETAPATDYSYTQGVDLDLEPGGRF